MRDLPVKIFPESGTNKSAEICTIPTATNVVLQGSKAVTPARDVKNWAYGT